MRPNLPSPTSRSMLAFTCCGFLLLTALLAGGTRQASPSPGQKLFLAKCAPCHGDHGQGGTAYNQPLRGNKTVNELSAFIHASMPPKGPRTPQGQAAQIADYIYDAFYSPAAQPKAKPPRLELQHLTVRQFENSVSDLISGFHPATPSGDQHGLTAQYFKGRNRDKSNLAFQRIDPAIQFDFGTGAPDDKNFDPNNFSIIWMGSVLAPDTGEYEFSIHARHSCQLWINDSRYPIADGEVRSSGDADPTGTITLLGGRAYNLLMVFTKATQGVDMPNKKLPATPSYVTLLWRRPGHVQEPIPTQFLFPEGMPKTYVVSTPFPPDDRSLGYVRGDEVSKEWDDATTSAALDAADYVGKNLAEITGIPEKAPDREARLKSYCEQFLDRAFRRPITDDIRREYITKSFNIEPNPENAVRRVVVLALKSPQFLFREIAPRGGDAYSRAADLSFALWDSLPDPELGQAAAQGRLSTPDQLEAQADRMTQDNRAWAKLRQFLLLWLRVDEPSDIVKNPKLYPTFDARTASDLRTSLELFLRDTAWGASSSFQDLMLSDKAFLNGRLAALYGAKLPADSGFQAVDLDPGQRAGVITQPYLLSRFGYLDSSDPIHRGVLIYRNLLGQLLNPPPQAFIPLAASAHPDLTTRQRVSLQTKPAFCTQCHGRINPLGFTLERFDAIGRLRAADNGHPIDCSGLYRSREGDLVRFTGALDLAKYLAVSADSRAAFVQKLFLNVAKEPPAAYGPGKMEQLEASFVKNRYSIRSLLREMAVTTAAPDGSLTIAR